jgi:hypothetical protein
VPAKDKFLAERCGRGLYPERGAKRPIQSVHGNGQSMRSDEDGMRVGLAHEDHAPSRFAGGAERFPLKG